MSPREDGFLPTSTAAREIGTHVFLNDAVAKISLPCDAPHHHFSAIYGIIITPTISARYDAGQQRTAQAYRRRAILEEMDDDAAHRVFL